MNNLTIILKQIKLKPKIQDKSEYVSQTIDFVKEPGFNESKINNKGRCTNSK